MAFFQNTRKPEGLGGKLMVTMMNHGHASLSAFGLQHIAIQENASCLGLRRGRQRQKAIGSKPPRARDWA